MHAIYSANKKLQINSLHQCLSFKSHTTDIYTYLSGNYAINIQFYSIRLLKRIPQTNRVITTNNHM